jgi:dihydroorotase
MTRTILAGGRLIDPASSTDALLDVGIVDGVVTDIAEHLEALDTSQVIDVSGCIVSPGWIDAHVHLRDPGFTYKEDLESGARAALAGGFVRMCCMPNTHPALDSAEAIRDIVQRGQRTGVHIHPIGTISLGRRGQELAPIREMAAAGAIGFSDDGDSTISEDVMREALALSSELNLPIMVHCEDPALAKPGSMHRGRVSEELGDPGIPAEAEESYIERDIRLAEETGGWLHVLHVSTARGAGLVADAKARGVRVTAEVMPHHLTLTDEWVAGRKRFAGDVDAVVVGTMDTNAKVNPPLRPEADALALIDAVHLGVFDFMATDHAPHAERDKPPVLSEAAFGMSGLELAIPTMTWLVRRQALDWPTVIALFTQYPAGVLSLPGGRIAVGEAADITVIDSSKVWTVTEESLQTRSKNTPLLGLTMHGKAMLTMVAGEVRHRDVS